MMRLVHFSLSLLLFGSVLGTEPKYPARPLTAGVSIKSESMPVREVLDQILKQSGLDWFLDGDITGTATLKLTEIPWEQALEAVLVSQNLYSRRVGNLITVFSQQEVPKATAPLPPQVQVETVPSLPPVDFQLLGIVGSGDSKVGILNIKGNSKLVRLGESLADGSRVTRLEEAGIELLGADGKSRVFTF
ncbi:MAG: hypothetical protein H3C47_04000 [Candidatus Cloacimonetes bacterium]|nr:hypothetical protein [Candidatus Cloacimonadota bacterium]